MGGADRPADLISTLQNVRMGFRLPGGRHEEGAASAPALPRYSTDVCSAHLSMLLCCALLLCRSLCQCPAATGSPAGWRQQVFRGR